MSRFAYHFFVCVNERPQGGRPSCGTRGGVAIVSALQAALAHHPEACVSASVTACGCLGPCFDGPTMVVYPEGIWYAGVRVEDVDELVRAHLLGGRPVERLIYRWPEP